MEIIETANTDEEMSDNEVFFGKITLKEIKKKFNRDVPSKICDEPVKTLSSNDASLRLIETHSMPNLICKAEDHSVISPQTPSPTCKQKSVFLEDSFQLENIVPKLSLSPRNSDYEKPNSAFQEDDYILHSNDNKPKSDKRGGFEESFKLDSPLKIGSEQHSPLDKLLQITAKTGSSPLQYCTPVKSVKKQPSSTTVTPSSSSLKTKTPVFKTPANPPTLRKQATPRNTPGKVNNYQHIQSPIASYIKNSPVAPLVKVVHPKKPLPGSSAIPKLFRPPSQTKIPPQNKENFNIPMVAYKSAKKTQVTHLPDADKLPENKLMKIPFSNPNPKVMKHDKREINPVKKSLLSCEDSFESLPCYQAEVSLCTEKTAFKSLSKQTK